MGKAPAFQFYVRDWLGDPLLRQASPNSRGIWIDCLCYMWDSEKRGQLNTTPIKLSRMAAASLEEVNCFLNEITELEFGTIVTEENVTFPITEHDCNTNVTLINRRMYSDYKDKENTRLRVQKHRVKKGVKRECNGIGNAKVTPSSSSSSSFSKNTETPPFLKKDNKHFEYQVGEYFQGIKTKCETILKLPGKKGRPFNPLEWIQEKVNKVRHPGAMDETFQAMIDGWDGIDNPYGWADTILKSKNGNWIEKDNIIKSKEKWLIVKEKMAETFKGFEVGCKKEE